jgi:hypothetical protein
MLVSAALSASTTSAALLFVAILAATLLAVRAAALLALLAAAATAVLALAPAAIVVLALRHAALLDPSRAFSSWWAVHGPRVAIPCDRGK